MIKVFNRVLLTLNKFFLITQCMVNLMTDQFFEIFKIFVVINQKLCGVWS